MQREEAPLGPRGWVSSVGTPLRACPVLSLQAIAMREELHAQYARSLQEKDELRKRVRELCEKADELQLQLFQREAQLLATEGRLKRQQLETLVLVGLWGGQGGRDLGSRWQLWHSWHWVAAVAFGGILVSRTGCACFSVSFPRNVLRWFLIHIAGAQRDAGNLATGISSLKTQTPPGQERREGLGRDGDPRQAGEGLPAGIQWDLAGACLAFSGWSQVGSGSKT